MLGDTHVSYLSGLRDYGCDELSSLETLKVFSYNRDVLSLQNAHVSRLRSLTHFYSGGGSNC